MGQAKIRGSFDQRKAESIEAKRELDRLNAWLKSRRPSPKIKLSPMVLMAAVAARSPVFVDRNGYVITDKS